MRNHRACAWTVRLAALLAAAAVIPACSLFPGGAPNTGFQSTSSGPVAPGVANTTNIPYWTFANDAVPGPIGITGIGGVEVTYADVDAATYGGTPEGGHPISTSRSLDPIGEATINSAVQQLYKPNVNVNQGQQVQNAGPYLQTGDTTLAGVSRGRAKHNALHVGTAPDPGGLDQRLTWMKVNAARTNAQGIEIAGAGLTPAQAATQITGTFALNVTSNQFGAAGYWTSGATNYYVFTSINLPVNAGGP